MLGSLRFRLPLLFLAGVVLSGLVATVIAIRFFQTYTRTHAIAELRSESVGIVQLYALRAGTSTPVSYKTLVQAIGGDQIYFVPIVPGVQLFQKLPTLPLTTVPVAELEHSEPVTLDLHWQGGHYLAVA